MTIKSVVRDFTYKLFHRDKLDPVWLISRGDKDFDKCPANVAKYRVQVLWIKRGDGAPINDVVTSIDAVTNRIEGVTSPFGSPQYIDYISDISYYDSYAKASRARRRLQFDNPYRTGDSSWALAVVTAPDALISHNFEDAWSSVITDF